MIVSKNFILNGKYSVIIKFNLTESYFQLFSYASVQNVRREINAEKREQCHYIYQLHEDSTGAIRECFNYYKHGQMATGGYDQLWPD